MSPGVQLLAEGFSFRLRRRLASLRTQLIFLNVIAVSLLLGGLGIICRFITLSFIMQSVDQELETGIDMYLRPPPSRPPPFERDGHFPPGSPPFGPPPFRSENHFPPEPGGWGSHRPPPRPQDANNPFRPHLFNSAGQSEMPDKSRPVWDKEALARALKGETLYTTVIVNGDPIRILSSPAFDHWGRRGAVQNAYPLQEVYLAISGIDMALLLLIPVGLLGAGWAGVALTDRVLRRVQQMTQAAGRIGAEDFSRRLPISGNDEFSELAQTFNGLLGRLERAFQEQKRMLQLQQRFTADASHELKTPLTIIKGCASLALGRRSTDARSSRAFREIDEAANAMSQLVQDLLLLARADEGKIGRESCDLLLGEVLERATSQPLSKGGAPITLRIESQELGVTGNEAELVRLFRNLLDNALRYTPAEGSIVVAARSSEESIVVTVEDTGTGIAPEHLPHLGERFYRVDASRARPTGGAGLGLSICKSIVEAHGGSLSIESTLGKGTMVSVTLPCAKSPTPIAIG